MSTTLCVTLKPCLTDHIVYNLVCEWLGTINYKEFAVAAGQLGLGMGKLRLHKLWRSIDTDGQGEVSIMELADLVFPGVLILLTLLTLCVCNPVFVCVCVCLTLLTLLTLLKCTNPTYPTYPTNPTNPLLFLNRWC
jgi:hypothetical protein